MTTTNSDPLPNRPVWDDAAALDLTPLHGEVQADVCVVGLGGSGLSAVHELLSLGRSVVGVDAGAVGGAAAGRNGGFLLAGPADFQHDAVAKHGRERAVRMYELTLAEIERMAGETPGTVRRVGSIRLAASDDEVADCRVQLDAMRADGLPAEWYEGPLGIGLRIPTDCAFQPMARARALARAVLDGGARLFERSPAIEIAGDTVRTRVYDISRTVEVSTIIEKRVGAPVAATCYVDHTPPPPPPAERVAPVAVRERGAGRPTKRDRRRLEAFQRAATIDGVEHEVEPDSDDGPVSRSDSGH